MSLLKRLFGGGGKRVSRDETPRLASELQASIREAERLVAGGRLEEALKIAERGLRAFPTAGRLTNVVRFIQQEGALHKITRLKEALTERREERAYAELIQLYLDLSKVDSALETAQTYVQDYPESDRPRVLLAQVQLTRYFAEHFARDAWAAHEALQNALEVKPEGLRAQRLLATFYFAIGAMRHCTESIDAILEIEPDEALKEFREEVEARAKKDEDVEWILDDLEEAHALPNDPGLFPGSEFSLAEVAGAIDAALFADAAAGIGRKLRVQQLAAVDTSGKALAFAGEDQETYVPLACRLDEASRRAGRRMSFGTMKRFMVEGKFGRIVLVPAGGKSAVAARVPRSVPTDRVAEGLEMIVTASRAGGGEL